MKKSISLVFAMIIALAMINGLQAEQKVTCFGKCNDKKKACEADAKKAKYKEKDGMKKALDACEKTKEECKKSCK